ncbi:putative ornithine cyclodeaminase [Actinoplanes missouriensis 431]|uniref:Putative ornithine cyclodeaminase n=1 Tax=Actinoplanes missouriensis (strain ATCC 14538 / DSM 43046 / CBS 188.64 / JCM 3121 / NBRC 102363 / NCIMB 12654 / NRRL B-3342 / UNCC 431) TaxID=512565 RepID=I0HB03_ACTM4|nr:2,3-diaminopropionate biosynthesis protein SbnB [Actinoplanes missouriensis]BAL90190.1 putative ornithine cyclodeaminase [Actinoplanes missouriensis 431]
MADLQTDFTMPSLRVLTGADVLGQIRGNRASCVDAVRNGYLTHAAGEATNPHSAFLRFPHKPNSRIISLPAYLGGEFEVAGIKWIASFPDNPGDRGIPRASAVLLLNSTETGYPFACMEASIISATRTAASAVLGAENLVGGKSAHRVGIVGTGLIARHVTTFLAETDWRIGGFRLFDLDQSHAAEFGRRLTGDGATDVVVVDEVGDAFRECDLVILTTVAGEPHIHDPGLLSHAPVVLHLSLRDLAPEMILAAQNFTDDVDHAVRERTSLHLTEQLTGDRAFITGTIADLLTGSVKRDPDRAAIFSPFGLGVLDLAVGKWVYDRASAGDSGDDVTDFFGEAVR